MISIWKSFLIEQAANWNLPQDGQWKALFFNNYQPEQSNINLLWFHQGESEPRIVTKMCREPMVLTRESDNMFQVYHEIPDFMPRPLHFGKLGDFWTLWMEGVPGMPFNPDSDYSRTVLRLVGETVVKIHVATRKPASRYGAERHQRMVLDPLNTLSRYSSAAAVIKGAEQIAIEVSPNWVSALPVIPQHGDLCFGNLIAGKQRMYVLDWETYGLIDLPGCDLITFLLSPLLTTGKALELLPSNAQEDVPGLIDSYAKAIGLCASDFRLLLPLALANWFRSQLNDGHRGFADKLYKVVNQYFENRSVWEDTIFRESRFNSSSAPSSRR